VPPPGGHLVTLGLNNNALGSVGVVALVTALQLNCSLKTLLLRCGAVLVAAVVWRRHTTAF
jgi:hypothetical protein